MVKDTLYCKILNDPLFIDSYLEEIENKIKKNRLINEHFLTEHLQPLLSNFIIDEEPYDDNIFWGAVDCGDHIPDYHREWDPWEETEEPSFIYFLRNYESILSRILDMDPPQGIFAHIIWYILYYTKDENIKTKLLNFIEDLNKINSKEAKVIHEIRNILRKLSLVEPISGSHPLSLRYVIPMTDEIFEFELQWGTNGFVIENKHIIKLALTHYGLNLETLPRAIGELSYLRSLHLEHNNLTSIPEDLVNLKDLRILDLYLNKISHLPDFLLDLPSLKILRVSPIRLNIDKDRVLSKLKKKGVITDL